MNTMRDLLNKYPHGYQGYEQEKALMDDEQTVENPVSGFGNNTAKSPD